MADTMCRARTSARSPSVLRHRIVTNFNAEAEGITPEKIIQRLADIITRPTRRRNGKGQGGGGGIETSLGVSRLAHYPARKPQAMGTCSEVNDELQRFHRGTIAARIRRERARHSLFRRHYWRPDTFGGFVNRCRTGRIRLLSAKDTE